jgi:hypothetical protein
MVRIASISSVPPHIHPPIAHVPSPIRDIFKLVPAIVADSMFLLPSPQIDFPDGRRAESELVSVAAPAASMRLWFLFVSRSDP